MFGPVPVRTTLRWHIQFFQAAAVVRLHISHLIHRATAGAMTRCSRASSQQVRKLGRARACPAGENLRVWGKAHLARGADGIVRAPTWVTRVRIFGCKPRCRPHRQRIRHSVEQRFAVNLDITQRHAGDLAQPVVIMVENRFGQMAKENLGLPPVESLVGHRQSFFRCTKVSNLESP